MNYINAKVEEFEKYYAYAQGVTGVLRLKALQDFLRRALEGQKANLLSKVKECIPEKYEVYHHTEQFYVKGYNDCRSEMLNNLSKI